MVCFEESNFETHLFGVKDHLIDEAIWYFHSRDHVNNEEVECINLLFEYHSYGVKHTLYEEIEDAMEIGELQVLNTMESSIVKLENHSHGVNTVRVNSYLAKAIMSEDEMKIRSLEDFIATTNTTF